MTLEELKYGEVEIPEKITQKNIEIWISDLHCQHYSAHIKQLMLRKGWK